MVVTAQLLGIHLAEALEAAGKSFLWFGLSARKTSFAWSSFR